MRSKLDPIQIQQLSFDEDSSSIKVKLSSTEMNMELSHSDGDSITSHAAKLTASAIDCDEKDNDQIIIPALDCSSLKEIRIDIDGSGDANIYVSPNDSGTFFYLVGNAGQIHEICARRVQVKSVNVKGNVHLVGKG